MCRHLLAGQVPGNLGGISGDCAVETPHRKGGSPDCRPRTASRPSVVGLGRQRLGQIGILDDRAAAIDQQRNCRACPVGFSLGTTLEDDFRILGEMLAEEKAVGQLDERIVDLEIVDGAACRGAPAAPEARCRPGRSSVPPWPLGPRNKSPLSSSRSLPVSRSSAGMVPWQKKQNIVRPAGRRLWCSAK